MVGIKVMSTAEWAALGDVIGGLGVIASLVFLAIQVRQNTRQIRSQGFQTALRQFLTSFENTTANLQDADLFHRGLDDFHGLSAREQGVFHSKMHSMLVGFNTVWNMHQHGLVPLHELHAMRGLFATMLGTNGGLAWWKAFKHVPPPVLVRYLDDALAHRRTDGAAKGAFPWLEADVAPGSGAIVRVADDRESTVSSLNDRGRQQT
jgi:hypothetical protein